MHYQISILMLLVIGVVTTTLKVRQITLDKNPERIIALGDYSYQPTDICWINTINSIKSITRNNIGNHENDASEGNSQYMKAFGLIKHYYHSITKMCMYLRRLLK
jgi:hypothetical protein